MIKRIFMKMSSVAVILFFFLPVLYKAWNKVIFSVVSLYEQLVDTLLNLIQQNILYGVLILFIMLVLIWWILRAESEEERSEREQEEVIQEMNNKEI